MGSPVFGGIVEGNGYSSSKVAMIAAPSGMKFSSQDERRRADHALPIQTWQFPGKLQFSYEAHSFEISLGARKKDSSVKMIIICKLVSALVFCELLL